MKFQAAAVVDIDMAFCTTTKLESLGEEKATVEEAIRDLGEEKKRLDGKPRSGRWVTDWVVRVIDD